MSNPRWLDELLSEADKQPFGTITFRVTRHRSTTSKVEVAKDSKLQPKDNESAFSDLEKFINSLILAELTAKVALELELKKGTIQSITIKNKDVKNYRSNS